MALFRRFPDLLERPERDPLEVVSRQRKALEARREPLSQANKFHLTQLQEFEVKFNKELEARRQRVHQHVDNGTLRTAAGQAARSRFFQLLKQRTVLQERADAERRRSKFTSIQKPFVDRSLFNYNPVRDIRTVFGTTAYLKAVSTPQRYFRSPTLVVPCLDRMVRKEVMFAKGHAGKGHRTRKRRGPLSSIGC